MSSHHCPSVSYSGFLSSQPLPPPVTLAPAPPLLFSVQISKRVKYSREDITSLLHSQPFTTEIVSSSLPGIQSSLRHVTTTLLSSYISLSYVTCRLILTRAVPAPRASGLPLSKPNPSWFPSSKCCLLFPQCHSGSRPAGREQNSV